MIPICNVNKTVLFFEKTPHDAINPKYGVENNTCLPWLHWAVFMMSEQLEFG
jgi:hypothetical protein